jgi:hypothetical protein
MQMNALYGAPAGKMGQYVGQESMKEWNYCAVVPGTPFQWSKPGCTFLMRKGRVSETMSPRVDRLHPVTKVLLDEQEVGHVRRPLRLI